MALKRIALLFCAVAGCRSPSEDWDDYLARTTRDGGVGPASPSQLADLNGRWWVHSLLAGGLDLGLRMDLAMDLAKKPVPLHATIWLAAADPDKDSPLLATDTSVDQDGTFTLDAEPLELAAGAAPGLNVAVSAAVLMDATTQSKDAWCGTATGSVSKPLTLDLAGSTFAARRDDGTRALADVPSACAPPTATPDGGVVVEMPDPPDLSSVPSELADLSGHWILSSELAGTLPLQLWASLTFVPAASGGGSLDGALRRATDPPGSPALASFSTTVDAAGRFQVWLPELDIGTVQASVLLVGATESADGFCGAGAGTVRKPILLDLAGTTFAAVRWTPGTQLPASPPNHCPP